MTIGNFDYWSKTSFHDLVMKNPGLYFFKSHKKVLWVCKCGREKELEIRSVTTGNNKSCGDCNLMPISYWQNTKFGKLRMKVPQETYLGSRLPTLWECDCGKTHLAKILYVSQGKISSCGKCHVIESSAISSCKFGKLRIQDPQDIHPSSHRKVFWICDCGKISSKTIHSVVSGHISSCGKCKVFPASFWENRYFGNLRMRDPIEISTGSNLKVAWSCRCGGEIIRDVYSVVAKKITRCGQCRASLVEWYQNNRQLIRSLKCPIDPKLIPPGGPKFLSTVLFSEKPSRAICRACDSEYSPRWGNVRQGHSLTCGCASNHKSGAQIEIGEYMKSLGLSVIYEHKVQQYKFDIHIPDSNLLIEYQGLRWHTGDASKRRDNAKYKLAESLGYDYMCIFEDEWSFSQDKVRNLLRSRATHSNSVSLRPNKCRIERIESKIANNFLNLHHYIGRCNAKIHYGVFNEENLVACASFSLPTRQSSHPWELVRMVSDPRYRVHGIWSKILSVFIQENAPTSIVSFSDNRLFSGKVYGKIGFAFDGESPPDYYWVRGGRRYHKSGLRKRGDELLSGKTETELREAEGYTRIWDMGKKRWVLRPHGPGIIG